MEKRIARRYVGGIRSTEFFITTKAKPQIMVVRISPSDARILTLRSFKFFIFGPLLMNIEMVSCHGFPLFSSFYDR
mgnify:FL=1